MGDERIDLSALDPAADAAGWERRLRSIAAAARPELARRAAARSPFLLLAGWARPALAAAAVLAAVSFFGILWSGRGEGPIRMVGVAEELGLPAPMVDWITEGRSPTRDDLLLALEGDTR